MTQAPDHVHTSTITFQVTYNGVTKHFMANPHATVRSALEEAVREFHIANQPHVLAFYRMDGSEVMPETVSLAEAKIVDGTMLLMRPSAVKGGALQAACRCE